MRDRVAVALDFDSRDELLASVSELVPVVSLMKVGLEAFVSFGPAVVTDVRKLGAEVFLDLKLHDIPNTVGGAAAAAARLGISLLTIHAAGGKEMMAAAKARASEAAAKAGLPAPHVVGITVLTSLDGAGLSAIGLSGSPREAALRLALLAQASGLDGVVCSPEEVTAIRAACGADFRLVVPGIRPAGADVQDQKRTATPASAIADGADLLVVGRPITRAPDRLAAARGILAEVSASIRRGPGTA